ncbi:FGGY family carbohydrate kinase [Mucilaginibacter boryungensis]|uniref:ATP:glycerol 3-phosphotransferase n=1 Tax=Mucilaginibacter boryungensis TaxID=768480 RepID=A0ABR9XK12_9SPHI|nr:glycerol kinase GlpK [Mucilaginibacter boryungensis]MBE9667318.1 glycerol kinase GlpK [Mucilaginibacter boryungensis]
MENNYILAIDQGTSSTKTIVFDSKGQVLAKATEPLKTFYDEGGFVEQDPEEIYTNVLASIKNCLAEFEKDGGDLTDIKTCGISNQRETFVVWNEFGQPLYNAVVWQCKRSVPVCKELLERDLEAEINHKTGLIIDPYFSGTKMMWLNQHIPLVTATVAEGQAHFGTVDTWLLYKFTKGKKYLTDYTNASRTLFFNLHTLQWDKELLAQFGLDTLKLPELRPSSSHFADTDFGGLLPAPIPVMSMIGDSHAAAFGEGCFTPGTAKATLGTGCSILMNIGDKPKASGNGMITTICWSTDQQVDYALEGVIVSCGSTVEWVKNELGIIHNVSETEALANAVADNNGVYLIPAFSGLGAPHWDMSRKASICGLTFDCNKNHVVRAALESIPYQIKDVITAMQTDAGMQLNGLMIHGGLTANQFVLNFLADLLDCKVVRSEMPDISALGAALLAGLKAGTFKDLAAIKKLYAQKLTVETGKYADKIAAGYLGWQQAVGAKKQEVLY